MHEFEALEDAVITALTPLLGAGLKTLEPYAGQMGVDELEAVTVRFPCIYVVAGTLNLESRNRYDGYAMSVTLIVGDRNVRGAEAATRGDSVSVGVYSLLESARGYLHNKKILSGWSPFVLRREDQVVFAPETNICIYAAEYETKTVK